MSFFHKLIKSVYSPELYSQVIREPLNKAIKYYWGMATLVAALAAVVLMLITAPLLKSFISELGTIASEVYPADLRLEIKNGRASINQSEPYRVALPQELIQSQKDQGSIAPVEFAVVIDTKTEFSYEQFTAYDTFAWVTRDGIALYDQDVRARYVPFGTSTSQVIDQAFVTKGLDKIVSLVSPMIYLLTPLFFLLMVLVALWNMGYGALLALVALLIANKVNRLSLTYGQAYAVTLHCATLGTVWMAIDWCIPGISIPFGFTVITMVIAYLNLVKIAPPASGQVPTTDTPASAA